jgi:hypothetical protein
MVNSNTLTDELILQKMSRQLKCLSPDDIENKDMRIKRYSNVVNEIKDAYRIKNFASRVLSLDNEAHHIELMRRKAYDGIASAITWLIVFPVMLYATGVASLIG